MGLATTLLSTLVLGWILLVEGAGLAVLSFLTRKWSGFLLTMAAGILSIVAGIEFVSYPLSGAAGISMIIGTVLAGSGGLLDCGHIDVCWICGLGYVRKRSRGESHVELLGAPVMKNPRYAGKPVYYSDVVERAESRFRTFDDLCGAAWAYNEPGSHSGYNLVRCHSRRGGKEKRILRSELWSRVLIKNPCE
jgi:hypothetical protein